MLSSGPPGGTVERVNTTAKKVFVGLSGGVDSSVSAALLRDAGYDVTGVFIKVWQADFLPCTWREERRDAMRAAAHLGIPFRTLDLEAAYKKEVVDYMIREYGAGRIPNPDVMCNKHVKFGAFLDYAIREGADAVATGHYARVESSGKCTLLAGADQEKDQSYFLWTLTQEQLARTLFPVGHLQKSAVRTLAASYGLPNAAKKDSQGLCFMGQVDMAEFLKHYLSTKEGDVLDESGTVIGTHEGALLYTIGQRRGFFTKKISTHEEPYVVVGKDIARNTITVSHRDPAGVASPTRSVSVTDLNVISDTLLAAAGVFARIRYRGALHPVALGNVDRAAGTAILTFASPVDGVAPGQSVVFYRGEECVGGAVLS